MKRISKILLYTVPIILIVCFFNNNIAMAAQLPPIAEIEPIPPINFSVSTPENPQGIVTTLQILFMLSILALTPSLILMVTCFTRFIIALHFLRSALGTQQMPPNQILISLALILTFYLMGPIFTQINETAVQPYQQSLITQEEALVIGMEPIREFMFRQVEEKDLALFADLAGQTFTVEDTVEDIPNRILIPAFMLGELTKGFKFGFLVYLPFIAIDMIVASTLMAMGMMMLPPAMISLPFKILLFVMVDGWSLVIGSLVRTFR